VLVAWRRLSWEFPLPEIDDDSAPDRKWCAALLYAHAEVKALCFQDETDALIFRSLASLGRWNFLLVEAVRRAGGAIIAYRVATTCAAE
jgi:hypothetical protein